MKKLRVFIQNQCPYCRAALGDFAVLAQEAVFSDIELELIDELAESELADSYDYFYVPTFYYKDKKLHEGAINKEELRAILEAVNDDDQ